MNKQQNSFEGIEYGASLEEYGQRRNKLIKALQPLPIA